MAKKFIIGADKVHKKFDWLRKQSRKHNNVGVIVGYTANYALYVHESVEMKLKGKPRKGYLPPGKKKGGRKRKGKYWDPQGRGQAKFLEEPFRNLNKELYETIYRTVKAMGISKGNGLDMGLMLAGQQLQRASQKLVPVEFGNLKGSAFTRLIRDNKGKG